MQRVQRRPIFGRRNNSRPSNQRVQHSSTRPQSTSHSSQSAPGRTAQPANRTGAPAQQSAGTSAGQPPRQTAGTPAPSNAGKPAANSSSSTPARQGSGTQAPASNQQTKGKDKTTTSGEAADASKSEDAAAKSKANSVLGSMFNSLGFSGSGSDSGKTNAGSWADKVKGVTDKLAMGQQKFQFNPDERKKAVAGLEALKKMAGSDGKLTPSDRGNIIGQMDRALTAEKNKTVSSIADSKIAQAKNNRGPLRKALFPNAPMVDKIGNKKKQEALRDPQHMNTARNTALSQLNQGFQDMGMKTNEPVSFQQGLQNARQLPPISMEDTNAFKDTMMMVRDKAKAMGLPEGKFEQGLPVGFLQDVLDGKSAMELAKYQGGLGKVLGR